jgi:hypothetical protein
MCFQRDLIQCRHADVLDHVRRLGDRIAEMYLLDSNGRSCLIDIDRYRIQLRFQRDGRSVKCV